MAIQAVKLGWAGPVFSSLAMSEEGVGEEGYVNPNRGIDLPIQICNNKHLITRSNMH